MREIFDKEGRQKISHHYREKYNQQINCTQHQFCPKYIDAKKIFFYIQVTQSCTTSWDFCSRSKILTWLAQSLKYHCVFNTITAWCANQVNISLQEQRFKDGILNYVTEIRSREKLQCVDIDKKEINITKLFSFPKKFSNQNVSKPRPPQAHLIAI